MNEDILEGKFKQLRGNFHEWWGKLTDDDLERIGGSTEKLAGVLQERYGYSKEEAMNEINKRMSDYDKNMGTTR